MWLKGAFKTRIGQTQYTHLFIHFFSETFGNMKIAQKSQNSPPPKKKIVGVWPTHPLPSFSRIFDFF